MHHYRALMADMHNEIIEVDIDGSILWLNTRAQKRLDNLGIALPTHTTQLSTPQMSSLHP